MWIEKRGDSYRIKVSAGLDSQGRQIIRRKTWRPTPGMTERQREKALRQAAAAFEREVEMGYQPDNRQTFAEYAAYVLAQKERQGMKRHTAALYRRLLERINPAIGHLRLQQIRPQHLNQLYADLARPGVRQDSGRATLRADLAAWRKAQGMTKAATAQAAGVSVNTLAAAEQGRRISLASAQAIADLMGQPVEDAWTVERDSSPLSAKTILEHHRLISTILAQAEREMLIPYNAAAKASPPRPRRPEPNYLQPEEIIAALQALEQEPLQWRLLVTLLIVTGARRGEIVGLTWDKIDWEARQLTIDSALLYADRETYMDTTKTGDVRHLILPAEVVALMQQHRREQLTLRLANGDRWQGGNWMFTRDDGRPMHPDSVTAYLSRFSARHGLAHINPHALRHSAASVLIASGVDVVTVAHQLGHSNPTTTAAIYSHLIDQAKAQAADCLADKLLRPAISD